MQGTAQMTTGKPSAAEGQIRVIAFQEGDTWSAQCLEYDIGAQAPDLETLYVRVVLAIGAERAESIKRNGKPFAGIGPAPERFHEMWKKTSGSYSPHNAAQPQDGGEVDFQMALCA